MDDRDPVPSEAGLHLDFDSSFWALIAASLATTMIIVAIVVDVSPMFRGPGPYPPDWRYGYRGDHELIGLGSVLLWASGLFGLLWVTTTEFARRCSKTTVAICLPLLIVLSLGLSVSLLRMASPDSVTNLVLLRTTSADVSSFFTVGMDVDEGNVGDFLSRYPSLLREFPLHARTHPPGPALYFWRIKEFMQDSPSLVAWLVDISDELAVDSWFTSSETIRLGYATALTGAWGLLALGSLVCAPIYLLAWSLGMPPLHAMRTTIVWASVPSFCLHIPYFDHVVLLATISFAGILAAAFRTRRLSAAIALGIMAGLAGGMSLHLSYGAVVFLLFGSAVVCTSMWRRISNDYRKLALVLVGGVSSGVIAVFVPLEGYDPIESATIALNIHSDEFTERRSYWVWLVYNIWDLLLFVGCPVFVLAGYRAYRIVRGRAWKSSEASAAIWLPVATVAGILILDLSGTVRGEVSRIWLPIMPFFVISSLIGPVRNAAVGDVRRDPSVLGPTALRAAAIMALQIATTLVIRSQWNL